MARAFAGFACLILLIVAPSRVFGQKADVDATPVEQKPWSALPAGSFLSGLNAAVTLSGVHDSYIGWYDVVTPELSYVFSPHYSADTSLSIYPYRYEVNANATNAQNKLLYDGGDVGDMLLEGHAVFQPRGLRSISTAAITMPTGDRSAGLGTGRVTFNLDNRFEHYFSQKAGGNTGMIVDIGGGDSSGLANRLVTEDDNALGPLAQFQAGFATWLPRGISMQSVAYEQLPIGDQKTYKTVVVPGRPPMQVVTGRKVNEDNGFTTSLYVPLASRVTLTSFYNRSLRLHLDTVSVGFAFSWKGTSVKRADSLIDRAMREAEFGKAIPLPVE